jgi:hypothetical protein
VNARRIVALAASSLAILAAAGCSSGLQPAIEMPFSFFTLSTSVAAGKIEPPESSRTVVLPASTILLVQLAEYPGFDWHADNPQNTSLLSAGEPQAPGSCPTGTSGCVTGQDVQYVPEKPGTAGTTKITFTLVATGESTLSPTAEPSSVPTGGPSCPAGITTPPPSADIGCVLGSVTLTVKVG